MSKVRKVLKNLDAPYIQTLKAVIETQSKATLAFWAIGYAEHVILPLWGKNYPHDKRPEAALEAARKWLLGEIKFPEAKPAILACHAAAREAEGNPVPQAAARAIGHCAATIHSARHCIGLAYYGALAVAYSEVGTDAPWEEIEEVAARECGRMEVALRAVAVQNEPNPAQFKWR